VVENGEAVTKPNPFHSGRRSFGSGGRCRTTTALADPVVPDVYMRSLVSPSPSPSPWGGGRGDASAWSRADHSRSSPVVASTRSPLVPVTSEVHDSPASVDALARTTVGSAWSRIRRSSGPANLVLTGTATAPARCTAV